MKYKFLIYWIPKYIEEGQPEHDVIICETPETAFLTAKGCEKQGAGVEIYQRIELDVLISNYDEDRA